MLRHRSIPLFFIVCASLLISPLVRSFANTSQCQLTLDSAIGGTTVPSPGIYPYAYATNVTINAVPDAGYIFDYWTDGSGHFMGGANPILQTLYSNLTLQPLFENISTAKRVLTIGVAADGTTDPSPGNYTYSYRANVTITAIPESGYVFDFWADQNGNSMGNANPMTIEMEYNMTLQPVFENATSGPRTLTIFSARNGTTDPPPGTHTYNYGENITVTAIPENGTYFGGWFLDQASGGLNNPITVTMDSSHMLGPNFVPEPPSTVQVTISPATGGTTDPAPGMYTYPVGNQAKVTAIPDSGWWLDYWLLDGNRSGNSTTIEFPLNENHTVRPLFSSNSHPASFMLTVNGADGGTTNPSPGTYTYDYGVNVTVTAMPKSGQSLEHWVLDGQTVNENPITLKMTQDHTIQPVFTTSQSNSGQGGHGFNLNIPPVLILIPGLVITACCIVGYLAPLGLAIRKGKVALSVRKPRLVIALISILIIVGPLGVTLLAYSGNLNMVITPSNIHQITNALFGQGGLGMPNITSAWCNLTSQKFCLLFNFTNPTATDLTLIALSANLTDHSDSYPLGQITLANPVTAGANETVTFQITTMLSEEATGHVATAHAGANSFDVDLSSVNINYAGIMIHLNGTSTVNNVSILR